MSVGYTVSLLITIVCNDGITNPFSFWDNLDKKEPQRVTLSIDSAFTRSDIHQYGAEDHEYKDYTGLIDFYLGLPPPPPRTIITKSSLATTQFPPAPPPIQTPSILTFTPPPPPNYQPMLNFLQGAPGGSVITVAHLQQLQPHLMALAANPNNSQLQYAALQASRSILMPLGLWNQSALTYIMRRSSQATALLRQLYNQIMQPGQTQIQLGATIQPPTPPPIIINQTVYTTTHEYVDVLGIVKKIRSSLKSKDWLKSAEEIPELSHELVRHLPFSKPRLLLYGSKKRNYGAAVITERRKEGWREVHVMNRYGYFVNDFASSTGRWYQGSDDITLNYFPINVADGRIDTLDVIGSNRYVFMKRVSGGNLDFIDRVATYPLSTVQLGISLVGSGAIRARFSSGYASDLNVVGAGIDAKYGNEFIGGRIGVATCLEADSYGAYVEAENYIRTPKLMGTFNEERSIRTWASIETCASWLVSRHKLWTHQGDVKLVPELHFQLATPYTLSSITFGSTLSVVPYGKVHLNEPSKSMALRPIRAHIEGQYKIRISKLLEEESDNMFVNVGAIAELSRLNHKAKFSVGLQYYNATFNVLSEIDQYKDSSYMDAYLGAGSSYKGFSASALKSIKNNDFKVQVGIKLPL